MFIFYLQISKIKSNCISSSPIKKAFNLFANLSLNFVIKFIIKFISLNLSSNLNNELNVNKPQQNFKSDIGIF